MSDFQTNVVTHFPSKSLGTLFRNPNNSSDPNFYVLFSGHVCQTDTINATFLLFNNTTVNAKILNVCIWLDIAVAVIENPTDITFAVTTLFLEEPDLQVNQNVNYFSNYDINNSLPEPITSNVRDPSYHYPQECYVFFYPESFLLKEGQGVKGVSGSPVVNSNNQVVGTVSKIIGDLSTMKNNEPDNLVCIKSNMFYLFLFGSTNGLITQFYKTYLVNPAINVDLNLLVTFRNSFIPVFCHLGFFFESYKYITSNNQVNLSEEVNGIKLCNRITGLHKSTYRLIDYLQKNDNEIFYFRNLLDGTDIMNDFYLNKTSVIVKQLIFTDKKGQQKTLNLGKESISQYYVNGDSSKSVTLDYYLYAPSGEGGVNMTFGPRKSVTVTPFQIPDDSGQRYTSQLPNIFVSTSSRSNSMMILNLYNLNYGMAPYLLKYSVITQIGYNPYIENPTTKSINEPLALARYYNSQYQQKIGEHNTILNNINTLNQINSITYQLNMAFIGNNLVTTQLPNYISLAQKLLRGNTKNIIGWETLSSSERLNLQNSITQNKNVITNYHQLFGGISNFYGGF